MGPRRVLAVYMIRKGSLMTLHIVTPPKIHEPDILHPKKIPVIQNFVPPPPKKKQDLNPSTLIYSIKQIVKAKKNVTDLLTQKNTEGVIFNPKKCDGPRVMYTANNSLPPSPGHGYIGYEYFVKRHNHHNLQIIY